MADELTPDELEVLRLINKDGIEANLTSEQCDTREDLEEAGYVEYMGDEYDFNVYLTEAGEDALNQADPAWWLSEYQRWQWKVKQARENIGRERGRSESYVAHLGREIAKLEKQIADEAINGARRLVEADKTAANMEHDFQEWIKEHKDKLPPDVTASSELA